MSAHPIMETLSVQSPEPGDVVDVRREWPPFAAEGPQGDQVVRNRLEGMSSNGHAHHDADAPGCQRSGWLICLQHHGETAVQLVHVQHDLPADLAGQQRVDRVRDLPPGGLVADLGIEATVEHQFAEPAQVGGAAGVPDQLVGQVEGAAGAPRLSTAENLLTKVLCRRERVQRWLPKRA